MNNKFFKIITAVFKVAVVLLVVFIVSVILIQRIFDNNVTIGGYRIFTIITGSMEPEYKVLDVIVSKERSPENIEVGDDVVYLGEEGGFENKVVTHRVIKIDDSGDELIFHTQGIANHQEDPPITSDQVYGVVLFKSHTLSFISKVVSHPIGFMFLVMVPLAILIVSEVMYKIDEKD